MDVQFVRKQLGSGNVSSLRDTTIAVSTGQSRAGLGRAG